MHFPQFESSLVKLASHQSINMQQKETRAELHGENTKGRETTRDERVQIIALRDKGGMKWKDIGIKMNLNLQTCQRICQRAKEHGM